MITPIFIAILTFTLTAQGQSENTKEEYATWVKMDEVSVKDFVEALKVEDRKPNVPEVLTVMGQADPDWVKKEDIGYLMSLIDSKHDAKCVMRMISSNMGSGQRPTLGDQVILLIESYRNKKAFPEGLTVCGDFDEAKREELREWWEKLGR